MTTNAWPHDDNQRQGVITLLTHNWTLNWDTGEWTNKAGTIIGRLCWDDNGACWIQQQAPPGMVPNRLYINLGRR